MAIFAQRAFHAFRPGGVKIYAGAPVIEPEWSKKISKNWRRPESEFSAKLVGSVKDGKTRARMVSWARKIRHPEHDSHRWTIDPRLPV